MNNLYGSCRPLYGYLSHAYWLVYLRCHVETVLVSFPLGHVDPRQSYVIVDAVLVLFPLGHVDPRQSYVIVDALLLFQ